MLETEHAVESTANTYAATPYDGEIAREDSDIDGISQSAAGLTTNSDYDFQGLDPEAMIDNLHLLCLDSEALLYLFDFTDNGK